MIRAGVRFLALAASVVLVLPSTVSAQGLPDYAALGFQAPAPPAVIHRTPENKITIRAVRIGQPLDLDGRIEESVYETTTPIDRFEQQFPKEGEPATERTQAWVFFDDEHLYFAARCFDEHPERIIANELRHDSNNIYSGGDSMTLVLDPFYDHRNGVLFQTNPLGALREMAIADGVYIENWNTVWDVRATRFEGGWSLEMAIPFKSLRYRQGGPQIWGINFRRLIRSKNEFSGVTPVPASFGPAGLAQMQVAATLVGLEAPPLSRNFELKPYAVSSSTTDLVAATPFENDLTGNAGIDLKYGLSRGLTADFTVNTDFAQIEEDVQQVNLTRYSILFPEKRDFFLEGQGIYGFGSRILSGMGSGDADDVPIMFFSRQIGLFGGQTIPVLAGGRVTGKAGPFDIAALNIQTGEKEAVRAPSTNFTAVRLRRDIFRRSNVGIIATARKPNGGENSLAFGADTGLRVSPNTTIVGYFARTDVAGKDTQATSYRGRFDWAPDRYGVAFEHLMVGPDFAPAVGYTRRENFRRDSASARFSPRLRNNPYMRKLTWQGTFMYDTDADITVLENRSTEGSFGIEFHNADTANVSYVDEYERLPAHFRIATGVTVPAGGYNNSTTTASYTLSNSRVVAGRIQFQAGDFYNGTRRAASYSGRIALVPQFALEPSISLAWVDLPYGEFSARLFTNRFTFTPTTRLLLSSLVQFNASARTIASSVRLRWEYLPGSELFVVYSDGRDTVPGGTDLMNRTFAVKATRLVRF